MADSVIKAGHLASGGWLYLQQTKESNEVVKKRLQGNKDFAKLGKVDLNWVKQKSGK
jgi:hypothetical protein